MLAIVNRVKKGTRKLFSKCMAGVGSSTAVKCMQHEQEVVRSNTAEHWAYSFSPLLHKYWVLY